MQTALTIAGSDSGGGAGIQADLRTFQAHGVFGTSVITAVTAQNTLGVRAVQVLDPSIVRAQIEAVADDFAVAASKIGMLATAEIIQVVAAALGHYHLGPIILDPVMVAKGGDALLAGDAVAALREILLPRATLVTPNIPEAEVLTGLTIGSVGEMRAAAGALLATGVQAVVIKGGHLAGPAVDVYADVFGIEEFAAPRIDSRHTHGTGCTFSAAVAAQLALGEPLKTAVRLAKTYVLRAIEQAPQLGHGHGPLGLGC